MAKRRAAAARTPGEQLRLLILLLLCIALAFCILILINRADPREETTLYDATAEVSAALSRLDAGVEMAEAVTLTGNQSGKLRLVFSGLADEETMSRILTVLSDSGTPVSFYLSGLNASEDPAGARRVAASGYPVCCKGLTGAAGLESRSAYALTEDFARAAFILREVTGQTASSLLLPGTKASDLVRLAAGAAGFKELLVPEAYLTYQSYGEEAQILTLIDKLPAGGTLCVELDGASWTADAGETEASSGARLVSQVEWLLAGLANTRFSPDTERLRKQNAGARAQELMTVYTTKPAAAFLFAGLGNERELAAVLKTLAELQARATFFVTLAETERCAGAIRSIVAAGHELGVAVEAGAEKNYYDFCSEILLCRETLKTVYGAESTKLVKQPRSEVSDALLEAVSATGSVLLSHETGVVRSADRAKTDAAAIIGELFGTRTRCLRRGHLVYFAMDFYTASDTLLSELVANIGTERNVYALCGASELLADTGRLYEYPLPVEKIAADVRDKIYPGQLAGDAWARIGTHYIGSPFVDSKDYLPDFSAEQIRQIDKTGLVKNADNAAFLTFDDWGSDDTITRLLNVLEKHGVKATFFVRTNHVSSNPNLLRAIAEAGHDIASHTNEHYRLADDTGVEGVYRALTGEEVATLSADLIASYQTLQSVVGDVRLENGKPALTTLFRPPTLAVSLNGLRAVFDCGFSYVVSGSFSTGDYEAKNIDALYRSMRAKLVNGAVLVMHFSDNSAYTADAVDLLLTENEARPEEKRFHFARLSDYLD